MMVNSSGRDIRVKISMYTNVVYLQVDILTYLGSTLSNKSASYMDMCKLE